MENEDWLELKEKIRKNYSVEFKEIDKTSSIWAGIWTQVWGIFWEPIWFETTKREVNEAKKI